MRVEVLLPQWGMGMSEGVISLWLKKVGDSVKEDEPIAQVEAEKVEEELTAPVALGLRLPVTEEHTELVKLTPTSNSPAKQCRFLDDMPPGLPLGRRAGLGTSEQGPQRN